MRRTTVSAYYWSRYRLPAAAPRFDGPAPVAAPQNMNNTDTNEFIDPIDDKFPQSIRGSMTRPDVPTDQYVDSWYICDSMTHHRGDFRPWSSSAPANAFRFRPFNEFDAKGREIVGKLRSYDAFNARHSVGRGQSGFPFREAYLTKMNPENATTPPPSLSTTLSRAVRTEHMHQIVQSPLEEQRDVGRVETVYPGAGNLPVDKSRFPYNWKTEDFYEYEVSRARMKRFVIENEKGTGLRSSEVTYKLVLEGMWDHHVQRLADDVAMFLKDVGRQVVEERLTAIRKQVEELRSGRGSVDPELLAAFNSGSIGPFGGPDLYSPDEIGSFLCSELMQLEEQCVKLINRCNVPVPGATNLYDPQTSWPYVENLEPWVRMAEYWTSHSDTSFTELEMSTAHAEFRRYFRVVVVKMPFQSSEFEKRMYDIRHWLHRQTTVEFQTIYKRNHVHDASKFPTEHDPLHATTHEHHRMFSFALDWNAAPAHLATVETVRPSDTWATIATRVGTSEAELRSINHDLDALDVGATVVVPPGALRRTTGSRGSCEQVLPLKGPNGERHITNWSSAANELGCTVEELQQSNGSAVAAYDVGNDTFDVTTTQLLIPETAVDHEPMLEFAKGEEIFESDTWDSVAERLGCSVQELQEVNPGVDITVSGVVVNIPQSAKRPRRLFHPLLRPSASIEEVIPRTKGEEATVPEIDRLPKNASLFPHEYNTPSTRFPVTPKAEDMGADDWLSYTARYLDKDLSTSASAEPMFTVNRLWPMQQVPGKVDATPFEEDQTWMMHHIPVQQMEMHHHEKDLQDLPLTNHEQFAKSIEWTAP